MNPIDCDLSERIRCHQTSGGLEQTEPRPSGSGGLQAGFGSDNRFLTGAARIAPCSKYITLVVAVITGWMNSALAQDPMPVQPQPVEALADSAPVSKAVDAALSRLTARGAVHEGNRRLLASDPTGALEAYRHAETQSPNASEIAFVEGLAQYDLKAYEQAREAFEASAATSTGRLANDARYSLGTCDHAEALDHLDDPKAALGLLEKAMRRYQGVLADDTKHEAARDAMLKAATMRRQIKQQMQEQPQQQQSDENQEDSDDQDQDKQESEGDQEKKDDSEQQQNEDQEQKPDDSSEKQEGDQQEESSQSEDQQPSDDEDEQQPSEAEEKEQESREQAERKLREMMQAMRDRKKSRQEVVRTPVGVAVKKDW